MYYPKSQIIENQFANPGDALVSKETGQEYVGPYFKTSDNKYYTGKNPQDKPNVPLLQSSPEEQSLDSEPLPESYYIINDAYYSSIGRKLNAKSPRPARGANPFPTQSDYTTGEFQRYFLYRVNTKKYLEVNQKEFNIFKSKNNEVQWRQYYPIQMNWNLTGDRNNVFQVNFRVAQLTEERNRLTGFTSYFKNKFSQYFKFAAASNLETKGGEFVIRRTGEEYVGKYHVHPDKGPMVGAKHVLTPHELLTPISGSMEKVTQVIQQTTNPTYSPPTRPTAGGGSGGGY